MLKIKILIGLILFLFISCGQRQDTNIVEEKTPNEFLIEHFVDSINIGIKNNNKIELYHYKTIEDSSYVIIKFYSKQNQKWILKNKYEFEKDVFTAIDTKLNDFNNDSLNDVTYLSNVAARGGNEVRRLFIYDNENDQLKFIKNSENYPNMLYNKELNCIDSWIIYGGCSTVFLEIKGDSLREFASVNIFNGLSVVSFDEFGNESYILEDPNYLGVYERFINYNPIELYENLEFKND